jgi:hypothetical protein
LTEVIRLLVFFFTRWSFSVTVVGAIKGGCLAVVKVKRTAEAFGFYVVKVKRTVEDFVVEEATHRQIARHRRLHKLVCRLSLVLVRLVAEAEMFLLLFLRKFAEEVLLLFHVGY